MGGSDYGVDMFEDPKDTAGPPPSLARQLGYCVRQIAAYNRRARGLSVAQTCRRDRANAGDEEAVGKVFKVE